MTSAIITTDTIDGTSSTPSLWLERAVELASERPALRSVLREFADQCRKTEGRETKTVPADTVVLDLKSFSSTGDTWAEVARYLRVFNPDSDVALTVADQIEQQTQPPKPPEPTALGAVVTDTPEGGRIWIRMSEAKRCWVQAPIGELFTDGRVTWDKVPAVRVIFDGEYWS